MQESMEELKRLVEHSFHISFLSVWYGLTSFIVFSMRSLTIRFRTLIYLELR